MRTKWMGLVLSMGVVGSAFGAEPPKVTPALLEKGKTAYASYCQSCHGEKGDGGSMAAFLVPKPRNFLTEPFKKGNKPEEIFQTITNGIPGSTMVAFVNVPEEDRWALAHYVLELQKQGKPADAKGGTKKAEPKKK
ncbi:cytochrome c [Vitiosangium sp. GDMCC 1.1324]|uniref:c-type cytochrome n=1 Tax=Vitiosangium sp. (strain GDMCC 1.1324) TaxID=2138576 RepID=UPI000D3577C4|nr:cytochrome c [Vitiosangium sp. GDMCC 1.1324]PTL78615.1 cytochrome C [Vitiosangium sp. GDMCC 1.1324]